MGKLTRRLLLMGGGLVLLAPWAYPVGRTGPFRIRVVDQLTGHGLRDLRVTVENGPVGYTQFDGSVVLFLDNSLMNQTVRFVIEHHGVTTQVRLPVSHGGLVAVAVAAP
jgi:hypothetical protein